MQIMHSRSNGSSNISIVLVFLLVALFYQSSSLKLHSQYEHLMENFEHLAANASTVSSNIANTMAVNYTEQIVKINPNFSLAANVNERILKVQKQYLDHQQQILILSNFSLTSFDSTDYVCKSPSQNINEALQYRTTDMVQYLEESILKVNFIQNQENRAKAKSRLQNQILYMKSVEKLLKSNCKTSSKLSKTFFVSNPKAKNWILGDWTYDQFIGSYIEQINSYQNTAKCPIDKPFYTNNQCVDCQIPNNVFDMQQGKCSSCKYGQIVNIKTRKCASQINYVSNLMDTHHPWITKSGNLQTVTQKYNKDKNVTSAVVCPFQTPFVLSEQCSACPKGAVYVLQEKSCAFIPYNMVYDPNIHEIMKQLNDYQTNPNVSGDRPTPKVNSCPEMFPYFDQITCIQCNVPFYFSSQQKACIQCPDKTNCPPSSTKPKPQVRYFTNSLASNVTGKSTDQVLKYWDKMAYEMNLYDNGQQCPIQTPFYNSSLSKCVSCDKNTPLFNISTQKCVVCGANQTFNVQTYLCKSSSNTTSAKRTNLNGSSIWAQNYTDYKNKQNSTAGDQCPLATPYSTGTLCVNCNKTQIFNTTSLKCTSCSNNTVFNQTSHICNAANGTVQTDKKTFTGATNLWIANLTDYQKKQNASKSQQCTKDLPFSNGTSCITCKSTEIFNTSSLLCGACPNGTVYNVSNFTCSAGKQTMYMPGKTTRLIGTPSFTPANYTDLFKNLNQSQYTIQNCSSTEYSTKTGCVACKDTEYFCVDCLKCMNCTSLDPKSGICLDGITFLTNTTNLDKLVGTKSGQVTSFASNQTKLITAQPDKYMICDQVRPFSINKTCTSCSNLFNVSNLACSDCPAGQKYDSTSRICYAPAFEAISNLSYGVPPYYTANQSKVIQDYQKAKAAGVQICPFATPFFNGSACIKCDASFEYFNLDLKKCQNCPTGKKYDPIPLKCLDNPPKFYTNLYSSNLVYDGQPYNFYKQRVDSAKKSGAVECSKDTPYYSDKGCIKCTTDKPYFSLYDLTCKNCLSGYNYNSVDHECQNANGDIGNQPQATIQKSLANLFT